MTDDGLIGFFRAISADVGALRDEVRTMSVRLEKVGNDLAEFRADVTARLSKIERKVEIIHKDALELRADQVGLESRVEELEARPQ